MRYSSFYGPSHKGEKREVGGNFMNWTEVEGKWNQVKGGVKEKWGKLTDDDLTVIAGKRDSLIGKIQERYGITKERAEQEVSAWKIPPGSVEEMPKRKVG
jgi:uncharacterized protein YjbJ (UPF0337 family)